MYDIYDAIENLLLDEGPEVHWSNYDVIFNNKAHYTVAATSAISAMREALDLVDSPCTEKDIVDVIKSTYSCKVETKSCMQ